MNTKRKLHSSFRDPSGFLFVEDSVLYRQVNKSYKKDYLMLMNSGLYEKLVEKNLLIKHKELKSRVASGNVYKIIKPEKIPFVSYPYEWCFSQIKDAALTTLKIQKIALEYGMVLKDASAYNIQFKDGKPVFIDTLSFEKYKDGEPWIAYKQFCQHFLAPLSLMAYTGIRLNQLLTNYIDGIPLDLTSSLLPFRTRTKFSLLSHIHLHAKSQKHFGDKKVVKKGRTVNKFGLLALTDNLESTIKALEWKPFGTDWAEYYDDTNYSLKAFTDKKKLVSKYIKKVKPKHVWDLGANTGIFSRLASYYGAQTISFDIDPAAVEKNYLDCRRNNETELLPLLLDLTNPSPAIGWENRERDSLLERGPVDLVLALALLHHLVISNNVPIEKVAEFFSKICKSLIVEFIPKSDSQVQRLLANRDDIFSEYKKDEFESIFSNYFTIKESKKVSGSQRTMYLMIKK